MFNGLKTRYYLKDSALFNFWRLFSWMAKEQEGEDDFFFLNNLSTHFDQSICDVFFNLKGLMDGSKIKFTAIYFNKKSFHEKGGLESNYIWEIEKAKDQKFLNSINNIFKNKIGIEDLDQLYYAFLFCDYKFDFNLILESMNFSISQKHVPEIRKFLETYLEKFIRDELLVSTSNFYKFEKQKELFANLLKGYVDFGHRFLMEHDPNEKIGYFLFIHTLLAFEQLGYLEIDDLYCIHWGDPYNMDGKSYKAKVCLTKESLKLLELNGKDIEKREDEGATLNNNILFFQKKEFNFKDSPNQCDLLNTLFKDINKEWYYDEIQEDWDPVNFEESLKENNYWRKFYGSADEINKKIAIETGKKEFLIKNTKKIRINPKYL